MPSYTVGDDERRPRMTKPVFIEPPDFAHRTGHAPCGHRQARRDELRRIGPQRRYVRQGVVIVKKDVADSLLAFGRLEVEFGDPNHRHGWFPRRDMQYYIPIGAKSNMAVRALALTTIRGGGLVRLPRSCRLWSSIRCAMRD